MQRVVITGIGLVTPLGIGTEDTWKALLEGRSGIGPITRFDPAAYKTRFAGEVKNFELDRWVERRKSKEFDRFSGFAMAAGMMAWQDAAMPDDLPPAQRDRFGSIIGNGIGGLESIERTHATLLEKGPSRVSPYFIPATIANLAPGQLAMKYGLRGVNYTVTSACASGAHAIGEAMRWIQRGHCDVMLAGGTEAAITTLGVAGFNAMHALSTRNDSPETASRPFDKTRDGFVIGEGAGMLVLESLDHALRRGARIYAEVIGYGATDDAHHITQPAPEGEGAQRAMRAALEDAGCALERVGYINAHGTSTPVGDAQEAQAIRAVFGAHADKLAVSSTKSMMGHLLGAAGGVEAAITALTVARGQIAPTINLQTPDPACDLDFVPHTARACEVDAAMSNSFGFGGTNVTLIVARYGGSR